MAADRPVWGYGSGSFADQYRERERVLSSRISAESHTIPVTIAGEQGADRAGRLRVAAADLVRAVFGGLRRTLRRRPATVVLVARCVVAAAFCALLLHTLVYAAFLEDPLTWTLLAMAAGLRRVEDEPEPSSDGRGFARSGSDLGGFYPCLGVRRPFFVIAAAAVTVLLVRRRRGGCIPDLSSSRRRRPRPRSAPLSAPDPPEAAGPTPKPKPKADTFKWRHYGYSVDHQRWFKPPASFRGPFLPVWKRKAPALLEFPPVMSNGALFQLADNGQLKSLRKTNGKTLWKKKLGRLAASSPALDSKRVYVTLLVGGRSGRGRIVALRQRNGKRHWSRTLPSRSESSPLVHGGRIYFGSENGTLYCLSARTGKVKWTYRAAGAIKGSPTFAHGKLFFGDYGGRVQAVKASNGRRVWSSSGAGRFYATAAVAGRRVFIGSTAGRVYAFSTKQRQAALVAPDGALRLRVGGGQPRRGVGADGVRRLLRRALLRARRRQRAGALDVQLGREDLRLRDGDRPRRLLRRPRPPAHDRARHEDRPRLVPPLPGRLRPGHLRRQAPVPDRQPHR